MLPGPPGIPVLIIPVLFWKNLKIPGMLILVLVLVLKDSLRTFFKSLSLSWSFGVRSLSLSLSLGVRVQEVLVLVLVLWGQVLVLILVLGGSGPGGPCPFPWGSGPCPYPGPCGLVLVLVSNPCKDLFPLFHYSEAIADLSLEILYNHNFITRSPVTPVCPATITDVLLRLVFCDICSSSLSLSFESFDSIISLFQIFIT